MLSSRGPEWRWGPVKKEFFAAMHGKILYLAVGTGLDITGIDISARVLEMAQQRPDAYAGEIESLEMDVCDRGL